MGITRLSWTRRICMLRERRSRDALFGEERRGEERRGRGDGRCQVYSC